MPDSICLHPNFIEAVTRYYNVAIGLTIILSVIMVIVGGYQLVLSVGNPTLIEKGKKRIINALFGLGLAVVSGVILNFLNPAILKGQQQSGCPSAPSTAAPTHIAIITNDQRAS